MTNTRLVCVCILLLATGCTGNRTDASKRINLMEKAPINTNDSGLGPYYKKIYYFPYIVRLGKQPHNAFIQVDSSYFNTKHLETSTREDYYAKVIALLPKDDLTAYHAVWALPEMQKLQQADGGYGTIVTWIKEKLDKTNGHYIIEVRRNDIEQLSLVKGISYFRVWLHPLRVEIADESGYFVPLQSWRRLNK